MRRVTSPGGPHMSHVKRQRVAELKNAYASSEAAAAAPGVQRQQQKQQQQQQQQQQQGAASTSEHGRPQTAQFPYAGLDQGLKDGALANYFRGIDTGSDEAAGTSAQQPPAGSNNAADDQGYMQVFVEQLLSTNTSQSTDNLAAAAQKLANRQIFLDNPPKSGSAAAQAGLRQQRAGYCTNLKRRLKGRGSIVSQLRQTQGARKSSVSYSSLEQLHSLWKAYITGLLPQPQSAAASGSHPAGAAALAASAAGPSPAKPASAAAAASEERLLQQADLHGCLLRVVSAKDARHVGATGIAAAYTKRVVCIVDKEDDLHVVPLRGSVFQYEAPGGRIITMHGSS